MTMCWSGPNEWLGTSANKAPNPDGFAAGSLGRFSEILPARDKGVILGLKKKANVADSEKLKT